MIQKKHDVSTSVENDLGEVETSCFFIANFYLEIDLSENT